MSKNSRSDTLNNDSGIKYEFYDDGRITKATLYGVGDNLDNMMYHTLNNSKYFEYWPCPINTVSDEFTAKAKAHPHDVETNAMNPDTGMDIAHDRVMQKYHKAFDKKFVEIFSDLNGIVARMIHYATKKGINLDKVKSVDEWLKELRQD